MAEESEITRGGQPQPAAEREFEYWFSRLPRHELNKMLQSVPSRLRNIKSNKEFYKPLVISIGPYHRNNKDLERMQRIKVLAAQAYAESKELEPKYLYGKVETVAAEARKWYPEDATEGMSDLEFTRMMFLDGCFFLRYISVNFIEGMCRSDCAHVQRDLLLLENQLPFIILRALEGDSDYVVIRMMMKFIQELWSWRTPLPKKQRSNWCWLNNHPPTHLLHLLREYVLANLEDLQPNKRKERSSSTTRSWFGLKKVLSWCCKNKDEHPNNYYGDSAKVEYATYRSAKELKKVGIDFRASETHSFSDVRFSPKSPLGIRGELILPPILIDDDTVPILLNLAAYEMSTENMDSIRYVTSYICFLDQLIDHADDVMELRSKGILVNNIGSDKEVAKLFNTIATGLLFNHQEYQEVARQIESHCKNKAKIWVLNRLYTHFEAPWSRISFIAAFTALALSFVQAYFAVLQCADRSS